LGCQALEELHAANKHLPLAGDNKDDLYTPQVWRKALDDMVSASAEPDHLPKLQITAIKDVHPGTDAVGITKVGDANGTSGFFWQGFSNSPHKPFRVNGNDNTVIPPSASRGFNCNDGR
jgi:hypothetical protein